MGFPWIPQPNIDVFVKAFDFWGFWTFKQFLAVWVDMPKIVLISSLVKNPQEGSNNHKHRCREILLDGSELR